jgi:hypothetical protein
MDEGRDRASRQIQQLGIATAAPGQLDVTDQKRMNVKDGESVNKSRHTKNEASIDSEDEQVQVAK